MVVDVGHETCAQVMGVAVAPEGAEHRLDERNRLGSLLRAGSIGLGTSAQGRTHDWPCRQMVACLGCGRRRSEPAALASARALQNNSVGGAGTGVATTRAGARGRRSQAEVEEATVCTLASEARPARLRQSSHRSASRGDTRARGASRCCTLPHVPRVLLLRTLRTIGGSERGVGGSRVGT